ncbi:MAG: metalloregulator ArsR/SmtB family transcription factor [Pseudonocardia sp.]|nr:metalloregulator ArsR/SmtB family transcription factor [Pseudonocardia sp.]
MSDSAKGALFEQLARAGKALGNGKRLELVDLLAQGPRSVAQLADAARLGLTSTSAHLQVLKLAGLVRTSRDGTTIRYALAGDDVTGLYAQLRDVAAARCGDAGIAVREYLGEADTEQVDRAELLRRVEAGRAVLVDVRPEIEFAAGHIPGAVSIPLDELTERLAELPPDQEVVAYCRGAFCAFSHDAVRLLQVHGRRAVRLADGMIEWRLAGAPVQAG